MSLSTQKKTMKLPPDKKQLSQVDLQKMLASGAKLAADTAQVQVETLKGVVNQQAAEIAFLKAQVAMAESNRNALAMQKQANAARQVSREGHDKLSRKLAEHYKVDWKTSAFCPLTGLIEPLPAAASMGDRS